MASSYTPIRFMSYLGMLFSLLGFLYAGLLIMLRLFHATQVPGWTSLIVVMLIIGGLQMVMLGIIGEYVWRTLDEARARPRYIVAAELNGTAAERKTVARSGQSSGG